MTSHQRLGIGVQEHRSSEPTVFAAQICDEHGGALSTVATVMTGDHQRTVGLVAEVICCYAQGAPVAGSPPGRRAVLVRELYLRCVDSADRVAQHQGAIALALVRCGGLTYREVGELMNLPDRTVAAMLRASLKQQLPWPIGCA